MSNYKRLSPHLSVTGQIQPGDLKNIASRGFHTVINNRPDGEGDDQPTSDTLEKAARDAGLSYHHLPVTPGNLTDADAVHFGEIMDGAPGPVLAFCRTGTRSSSLWALSESAHTDPKTLIATADQAGYDLSKQEARLQQRWRAGPGAQPGRWPR